MTFSTIQESSLPAPALATPRKNRFLPWGILWAIVIILEAILLANNAAADTFLWRTTRWFTGDQDAYHWAAAKTAHANDPDPSFYWHTDPPFTRTNDAGVIEGRFYKRTEIFWRVMRDLGEPVMTVLIIFIVWIYDWRKWKAALIFLAATGITGIAGWLIRALAGRYRPDAPNPLHKEQFLDGLSTWLPFRGFSETANLSWPSGHATLAFATAAALTYLSPKGRNFFLIIATLCALTRVVMQAHFYSDVIFGAALGWTLGWFTAKFLDRKLKPIRPKGAPDCSHGCSAAQPVEKRQ